MPLTEIAAAAVTKAVFAYVLKEAGVADQIKRGLGQDPVQKAYSRALARAVREFEEKRPDASQILFDASFLSKEAQPILAQFLIRTGSPDPTDLASRWAESLNIQNNEARTWRPPHGFSE